jgi:hypothetical protein
MDGWMDHICIFMAMHCEAGFSEAVADLSGGLIV